MKQPFEFVYNEEIGIEIPVLHVPFDQLSKEQLDELYHKMEQISGQIPERIRELERKYREMYDKFTESDGDKNFYEGMGKINELSRKIGELNIWYLRMQGRHLTQYQG
jgi:hypothetical protein